MGERGMKPHEARLQRGRGWRACVVSGEMVCVGGNKGHDATERSLRAVCRSHDAPFDTSSAQRQMTLYGGLLFQTLTHQKGIKIL